MALPKKNVAYTFVIGLADSANRPQFKAAPTLAAGDFKVSTDGGALTNLATLPTVEPASSRLVKVALSAAEMNGDRIVVQAVDAAGAEWDEVIAYLDTSAQTAEDIYSRLGAPAGASMSADVAAVKVDTAAILVDTGTTLDARIPAALVGGRMDASVGAMAADTVTASAIATDAIGAAEFAQAAADKVWSTAARSLTDKVGFALSAAGIQAIWDALTSALTFAGSIGKLIVDNLNATISSRASQASVDALPTAAGNADAVWDEARAGHVTAGTFGQGSASVQGNVTGSVGSVTGAVGSVTGNVGGNVVGSVGSLAAQAKADVNAEVVDAVNVDTYAEPGQEAPPATTTLVKKIGYTYKAFRNRFTQDGTTAKLYGDDAVTVDQKATVSDDATTFTRGEFGTGP